MLEIGMYVRCPVDKETDNIEEARTFFLGQVTSIDNETNRATVIFHDPFNLRKFFTSLPTEHTYNIKYLNRTTALDGSYVFFKGVRINLLCVSKHANKSYVFNNYFVEYFKNGEAKVSEICETNIQIPFTRANYNPANQMIKYEFQNPTWYLNRKLISNSLNIIDNSPNGFKNLLGMRAYLFDHQLDTIVRALSGDPCRFVLADEAGLGKTIESIAILKGLMGKYPSMKSLIIVPDTLASKWKNELSIKVWLDCAIWGNDTIDNIVSTKILLVKLSDFQENYTKIYSLNKWSMCIVDETHKLLLNDDIYNKVLNVCKLAKNVLLLSALPLLSRQEEYFKLLTLLNPAKFEKMSKDIFNTNVKDIVLEPGIIKHRRAELEDYNIKRQLKTITYEMISGEEDFYEQSCYNIVLDCAEKLLTNKACDLNFAKNLISSVLSSPYAVLEFVIKNKKSIPNYDEISLLLNKWKNAVDKEILNIKDVCNNIELSQSKFSKVVDYIDQEDTSNQTKYLIFTSFSSTAIEIEKCFKNFFGNNSTSSFYNGKTNEQLEQAVHLFQNEIQNRFMICDESGGNGSNFQMADYIIHFDLPWSTEIVEKRICKLDTIFREANKDVTSIVVFPENSLENHLFNVYDKGLNMWQSALCSIEIAFDQINNIIDNSLENNIRAGISNCVSEIQEFTQKINEEIEKETYFELDIDLKNNLNAIISNFTHNQGDQLMKTIRLWPRLAGFSGISNKNAFNDNSKVALIDTSFMNERTMVKSLYFPPKMDEIIKRSKYENDIIGTFSRSSAVNHESLTFFAPFNPLFDSITTNAEECYKGRCSAFQYKECNFDWQGIIQIWTIKYNPYLLYKKNMPSELISLISRYLPNRQIVFLKPMSKKYENISYEEILTELDGHSGVKPIHLGKRDNGAIDIFKKTLPPEKWKEHVRKSYNLGKNYAIEQSKTLIEIDVAKNDLKNILESNNAREAFYDYKDNNILLKGTEEVEALIYGLENPIIQLDSIAFMILEKNKD